MEVCLHSLHGFTSQCLATGSASLNDKKTFPEFIHVNCCLGQADASRNTGHLPLSRFCSKAATTAMLPWQLSELPNAQLGHGVSFQISNSRMWAAFTLGCGFEPRPATAWTDASLRERGLFRGKQTQVQRGSYPCNRPWRPIGLWDVEVPTFCLDQRWPT
jgi:hypothetical protein